MKRTIYLVDPAGGGVMESPGLIVVLHKNLREIGFIDVKQEKIAQPGQLRVTEAALEYLGELGVISAFVDHLSGNWWTKDTTERELFDAEAELGMSIYNIDPVRRLMCITYAGEYTTLICSEEY